MKGHFALFVLLVCLGVSAKEKSDDSFQPNAGYSLLSVASSVTMSSVSNTTTTTTTAPSPAPAAAPASSPTTLVVPTQSTEYSGKRRLCVAFDKGQCTKYQWCSKWSVIVDNNGKQLAKCNKQYTSARRVRLVCKKWGQRNFANAGQKYFCKRTRLCKEWYWNKEGKIVCSRWARDLGAIGYALMCTKYGHSWVGSEKQRVCTHARWCRKLNKVRQKVNMGVVATIKTRKTCASWASKQFLLGRKCSHAWAKASFHRMRARKYLKLYKNYQQQAGLYKASYGKEHKKIVGTRKKLIFYRNLFRHARNQAKSFHQQVIQLTAQHVKDVVQIQQLTNSVASLQSQLTTAKTKFAAYYWKSKSAQSWKRAQWHLHRAQHYRSTYFKRKRWLAMYKAKHAALAKACRRAKLKSAAYIKQCSTSTNPSGCVARAKLYVRNKCKGAKAVLKAIKKKMVKRSPLQHATLKCKSARRVSKRHSATCKTAICQWRWQRYAARRCLGLVAYSNPSNRAAFKKCRLAKRVYHKALKTQTCKGACRAAAEKKKRAECHGWFLFARAQMRGTDETFFDAQAKAVITSIVSKEPKCVAAKTSVSHSVARHKCKGQRKCYQKLINWLLSQCKKAASAAQAAKKVAAAVHAAKKAATLAKSSPHARHMLFTQHKMSCKGARNYESAMRQQCLKNPTASKRDQCRSVLAYHRRITCRRQKIVLRVKKLKAIQNRRCAKARQREETLRMTRCIKYKSAKARSKCRRKLTAYRKRACRGLSNLSNLLRKQKICNRARAKSARGIKDCKSLPKSKQSDCLLRWRAYRKRKCAAYKALSAAANVHQKPVVPPQHNVTHYIATGDSYINDESGASSINSHNGATVVHHADGTKVVRRDGKVIVKFTDGTRVVHRSDGKVVVHHTDGSKVVHNPDGKKFVYDAKGKRVFDKSIPADTAVDIPATCDQAKAVYHKAKAECITKYQSDAAAAEMCVQKWRKFKINHCTFAKEVPEVKDRTNYHQKYPGTLPSGIALPKSVASARCNSARDDLKYRSRQLCKGDINCIRRLRQIKDAACSDHYKHLANEELLPNAPVNCQERWTLFVRMGTGCIQDGSCDTDAMVKHMRDMQACSNYMYKVRSFRKCAYAHKSHSSLADVDGVNSAYIRKQCAAWNKHVCANLKKRRAACKGNDACTEPLDEELATHKCTGSISV